MAFKLEDNEHIVMIARRHWFKPVTETIGLLFSMLIPIIISSVAYSLPENVIIANELGTIPMILILTWLFIVWNTAFIIWTNHYLDVLVITNKHIIDIEQIGLWNREISTLDLDKVQDISSRTEGIVASTLDYGELDIQTAGSMTNFIVKGIERPDLIRQKINEQISAREDRAISVPFESARP
jgi:hypothetical protein